jgi:two-component system sensor kinase FixL
MKSSARADAADVLLRVRSLLKKDRPKRAPINVRAVAAEVAQLLERDAAGRRVIVDLRLHDAGTMLGDPVQIQQVVLKLLMNAFDALDGRPAADRRVQLTTRAQKGVAVIDVTDTGAGLTDDELARLFEPFYTTTPSGLGLGLAICRTIVDAHGGMITAARNHGAGMTFSATFPLVQSQQADHQQQSLVRRRVEPT